MALPTSSPPSVLSAQVVGNAFIEQYYQILYKSPEQVHKFYTDSSMLSRPGPDGIMMSVTTMQGISEKIMSLDYKDYTAEIISSDAQDSLSEGVIVLVTGCLTGKDNLRRNFTQTFFLARQDKGYYVLNDVFRFVDAHKLVTPSAVNDIDENAPTSPLTQDSEPTHVPDRPVQNHTSTPAEGVSDNGGKVRDPSDIKGSVVEEVAVAKPLVSASQNDVLPVAELASSVQEDAQKMSYASILAKESMVTSPVHVPVTTIVRVAPSADQQSRASASPKVSAPSSNGAPQTRSAPQSSNSHAEGKGIYIGNLPTDITSQQLLEVVKKFGPVKRGGIQIRSYEDGFCFGFVEFESSNSAHSAIEARKIPFGEKEAYIMEKKSATQVGNGRGRSSSGSGGLHNDNYRGRENFGDGRRNGRYEQGNRGDFWGQGNRGEFSGQRNGGDFSGQARGPAGRNETYQRVYQNGGGRVARQGGAK